LVSGNGLAPALIPTAWLGTPSSDSKRVYFCCRVLATLGQNCASRKVTRRAIQEVDVPKACVTIDNPPGAPIALRLQASLLYGVSRVYSQQYEYLLGDAQKAHLGMSVLFRQVASSETLDPKAGQAK
jgi:hypothetical protein